jgi:cytochrome b
MAEPRHVAAWDLPTRLFKWSLVLLVIAAPLTKWYGDVTLLAHKMVGYAILTLVLWRVLWGFAGSTTARFATFVKPFAVFGYVADVARGRHPRYLGHNPAGALVILAFLAVLAIQATTGLFATDDIIVDGPLKGYVAHATSKWLTGIHDVLPRLLLALVAVHVLANVLYSVFGDNLILAMLSGRKSAAAYRDVQENAGGSNLRALVLLALSAAFVYGALALFGSSPFR